MKRPETRNVCVISTAHLSPATLVVLNGPREGWPIYGGPYGGVTAAGPDGFLVHVQDEEHHETLPADLAACCVWAKGFNPPFDYIMFDADANAVEGLREYDHE